MTPLIIYHGHCPDGFTSAWAAHRALKKSDLEPELYVGEYGAEPPYDLARNRDVYIVDFSYKRPQLERLKAAARKLLVLDHHKTAQAELEGLDYCVFDMNRSGAGITWDYFNGDFHPRPLIVDYVEDRDLWRFKLPHSEEISLRIRLTPHTIEAFDALALRSVDELLPEAAGAKLYLDHYVRDAVRNAYVLEDLFGGEAVRCVNVSYTGISDVVHGALELGGVKMALGWLVAADGQVQCSLRSVPGYDCSRFATSMGGGGHAQASGFRMPVWNLLAKRLFTQTGKRA